MPALHLCPSGFAAAHRPWQHVDDPHEPSLCTTRLASRSAQTTRFLPRIRWVSSTRRSWSSALGSLSRVAGAKSGSGTSKAGSWRNLPLLEKFIGTRMRARRRTFSLAASTRGSPTSAFPRVSVSSRNRRGPRAGPPPRRWPDRSQSCPRRPQHTSGASQRAPAPWRRSRRGARGVRSAEGRRRCKPLYPFSSTSRSAMCIRSSSVCHSMLPPQPPTGSSPSPPPALHREHEEGRYADVVERVVARPEAWCLPRSGRGCRG